MGRYQAYPEYINCEWTGGNIIPSKWYILGLGKIVSFMNNGSSENQVEESERTVRVTRIETISSGIIDINRVGYVLRDKISSRYKLEEGDIQFSNINSLSMVGNCAIFCGGVELYAGMNLLHIRPKKDIVFPKYMFYQLKTKWFRNAVEANAKPAINQASIPASSLKSFDFICPSYAEQQIIANFLDHETAKIDTLIEQQQQLIQLLKEKRQAVISHAVTKGLNPDAPMKDSGVEWTDQVPNHWKVTKLRYYAVVSNGATPNRENAAFWHNGNIGWLNSSKVNDQLIESADQFITELAVLKTSVKAVKENDLVMAITGEGQTRGRVAICKIDATINQHLASISLINSLLMYEFLYIWLVANYERIRFESNGAGSTKGAITCGDIESFPVVVPPINEQHEILALIKNETVKFDELEAKAVSAIELMQERRTALISAAVTGKIDVRNWQAQQQ